MHVQTQALRLRLAIRRLGLRKDVIASFIIVSIATAGVILELIVLALRASCTGSGCAASDSRSFVTAIGTAWAGLVVTYLSAAIKITVTRKSLLMLFTSEIRALQYGLVRMKMFSFYEGVYARLDPAGFDELQRDENYFALFHGVIGNVANLHPFVVEAIVRYYTYLKMSRDAASAFKTWKTVTHPDVRKLHVKYVVQLLCLSSLWGFVALWYMGHVASEPDRELSASMEHAVDLVFGEGEYAKLVERHPQHAALVKFFSSSAVQSSSGSVSGKMLVERAVLNP
jgi:hypothetical protein